MHESAEHRDLAVGNFQYRFHFSRLDLRNAADHARVGKIGIRIVHEAGDTRNRWADVDQYAIRVADLRLHTHDKADRHRVRRRGKCFFPQALSGNGGTRRHVEVHHVVDHFQHRGLIIEHHQFWAGQHPRGAEGI